MSTEQGHTINELKTTVTEYKAKQNELSNRLKGVASRATEI